MNLLSDDDFLRVIQNTPLVSIDFIIQNSSGEFLLGKRLNKPAKNFWFVPGGRIRKNEKIEDAFLRLTFDELKTPLEFNGAALRGVYQHHYEDSYASDKISTHYVVLAYDVNEDVNLERLPLEQHNSYKWFDINELMKSDDVHLYTKNYFQNR
ncbi:GDP-mannose mannosyl hydrolase [Rahnella sp. Larv3_ips]|uniref:GDP-mannose mannosyl hydrolase n=1 Tax=Rahnella sp. Larv3_ips TaxID=1896943 RepID=UPI000EFD754F|nr:GDP-mannose mannosyl hydrolase [Rahnella sp. Larv3_ips]